MATRLTSAVAGALFWSLVALSTPSCSTTNAFIFSSFTWKDSPKFDKGQNSNLPPIRKTIAISPPSKPRKSVPNRKTIAISQPKAQALIDSSTPIDVYNVLSKAQVINPQTGKRCRALDESLLSSNSGTAWPFAASQDKKALVVVMPQLGDFDSMEYADLLQYILPDLKKAQIELRIIGIGNAKTAQMFSLFTDIPLNCIRMDPDASIHQALELHRGPDWDVPSWMPASFVKWIAADVCKADIRKQPAKQVARAWLNYMAMCAGISAPGTLKEITRGYFGDKSAPERVWPEQKVRAGPLTVTGVTDVKIGNLAYKSLWKNEEGYLRPGELATVRLRSMAETLTKLDHYVPDQRFIDWRGATFLLESGKYDEGRAPLYEYRDRGVLSYSETMDRPLSFLSKYIGVDRARNPMGLYDPECEYY